MKSIPKILQIGVPSRARFNGNNIFGIDGLGDFKIIFGTMTNKKVILRLPKFVESLGPGVLE